MKIDDEDSKNGQSCATGECACPAQYIWGAIVLILLIFFIASRI
jgi:hypothetical protein